MDLKEKKLYHQIHPLKLATDWITDAISLYLLWSHQLTIALIVMLISPILASLLVVKFINLEKLKESSFGKYMSVHMTTGMEIIRLIGFAIAVFAAWYNMMWLIVVGIIIVILGWLCGIFM